LEKVYLEITNVCNLACPFCPPHGRASAFLSAADYSAIVGKLRGKADLLYFHLKGEPLLHPDLGLFLDIAKDSGLSVAITTNGTLLGTAEGALAGKTNLSRLNISLQSLACFPGEERRARLRSLLESAVRIRDFNRSANPSFLVSLRLWTSEDLGENALVIREIESAYGLREGFLSGQLERKNGAVISPGLAVHSGETFAWPSLVGQDFGERGFCRGLRDQAGILVDGTVVPCCLDGDGIIGLGNIFESSFEEILSSARARALYDGFTGRFVREDLCRRCGYRTRFGTSGKC
jgi:MoaA/NifB/PqqE/SkfB family radical SAM enzyme